MATIPSTINVRDLIKSVSSRSMFGTAQAGALSTSGSAPGTATSRAAASTITAQATVACFHIDEIVRGELLDTHRMYEVHDIRAIRQGHKVASPMQQHSRDCMTEQVNNARNIRKIAAAGATGAGQEVTPATTTGKRFVMKHIRKECMGTQQLFEEAALALENEATMMKGLCHPSIPRLRGMSLGGTEAYYFSGRHDSFFLLSDRIVESFQERVVRWRKRNGWVRLRTFRGLIRRSSSERAFLVERLRVALDIADGVHYMHEHGISHRSLDSSSIGFNASNHVQILQFGKARKESYNSPQPSASNAPASHLQTQGSSKRLSSLTSSTKGSLPASLTRNESLRSCGTTGSHPSELQQADHEKSSQSLGGGSSRGFQQDVLGYSKILCEILTMRSLEGAWADSVNHMSRQGKAYISDFRSLATKIPRRLLELLQRGLGDFADSRPTMDEYCACLGEVLFGLHQDQMRHRKESSNAGDDGSTAAAAYNHGRPAGRRTTQLGLSCEGATEEFRLMCDDKDFGESTAHDTEWDGTTQSHQSREAEGSPLPPVEAEAMTDTTAIMPLTHLGP